MGDIEGQPFLEAIRRCRQVGRENVLYCHVSLCLAGGARVKANRRSIAFRSCAYWYPPQTWCAAHYAIEEEMRDKMALFCNVRRKQSFRL